MRLRGFCYLSLILMVVTCAGCSLTLQSSQYDFVKDLFEPEQEVPEKNWHVVWRKRVYQVYAINHQSGTFFANEEGLLASFDGWQLVDLSMPGSLGKKTAVVNKVVSDDGIVSLQYADGRGGSAQEDTCSSWQRQLSDSGSTDWNQQCSGSSGEYTNEIRVNAQGQLVALRFMLVPGVEPIMIHLR